MKKIRNPTNVDFAALARASALRLVCFRFPVIHFRPFLSPQVHSYRVSTNIIISILKTSLNDQCYCPKLFLKKVYSTPITPVRENQFWLIKTLFSFDWAGNRYIFSMFSILMISLVNFIFVYYFKFIIHSAFVPLISKALDVCK